MWSRWLAHGWGTRLRPHVVVAAYSISEAARHAFLGPSMKIAAGHGEESFRYRAGGRFALMEYAPLKNKISKAAHAAACEARAATPLTSMMPV
jgi:hypothetical protein